MENLKTSRLEIESHKANQYYKMENMEKEIQTVIDKNNMLKVKIKKIKKFMYSLSKIIAESRVKD